MLWTYRKEGTMRTLILAIVGLLFFATLAGAQESGDKDPAMKAQNPLANIISMPFQNNTDFGIGEYDRTSNVLNIQPIYPINLGKEWILINRFIVPFPKTVPDAGVESGSTTGLGDINYTAWFSPPPSGALTWGFGLVSIWPTATDPALGSGKFSIGPSFVLVHTSPKFLVAAVIADWISVAGKSDRPDVHTFYFQYILTYFLPQKWYISTAPINTANWEAEKGQRWTVPIGGGFGKMFNIGSLPLDFQTQAFYYLATPNGGPDWQLRVQLKLIFPK